MMLHFPRSAIPTTRTCVLAAAVALTLGGCVSPGEQSIADAQQDQGVCAAMGAAYGSAAHTDCMLQQQQRRDQAQLILLEQARISYETAQTAQEMRESSED